MKHNRITDRGQVLIIFVFAIVGLIGMTGLAIDGGNVYSDRRHAQNAADTAALAASLTKVREEKDISDHPGLHVGWGDCWDVDSTPSTCGATVLLAARDMAAKNGYSGLAQDLNSVQVNIPPTEGAYAACDQVAFNCHDYVEVIIDSTVNTFFAKVLGIPQLHNHVQAVAKARYKPAGKLYSGSALVALAPGGDCTSSGEFSMTGNKTVKLVGSGIFINSDNACAAFKEEGKTGCEQVEFWDDSDPPVKLYPVYVDGQLVDVDVVQGVPGAGSKTDSCPSAPVLHTDGQRQQFPPDELIQTPPIECTQNPVGNGDEGDGYYHAHPGHYTSLPPAKNTFLEPGVYCVDSFVKVNNPQSHLIGQDVLIYIKSGGRFSFEGGVTSLSASTTDPYKGILIYVVPNYSLTSPLNCKIVGSAGSQFTGVIWAPYCDVEVGGGSDPFGLNAQIIAYRIKLTGTSDLTFTWNADDAPTTPEINSMGLFR